MPSRGGDPAVVATALANHSGVPGKVAGSTVTVGVTAAKSWSIAAWAVAHAQALGVTSVTVDNRTWSRETGTWTTGQTQPGVTISLGT